MKVRMQISKDHVSLCAGTYEVADADSFGKACADLWCQLQERQLGRESSVGALMENIQGGVLDKLDGAAISLERA